MRHGLAELCLGDRLRARRSGLMRRWSPNTSRSVSSTRPRATACPDPRQQVCRAGSDSQHDGQLLDSRLDVRQRRREQRQRPHLVRPLRRHHGDHRATEGVADKVRGFRQRLQIGDDHSRVSRQRVVVVGIWTGAAESRQIQRRHASAAVGLQMHEVGPVGRHSAEAVDEDEIGRRLVGTTHQDVEAVKSLEGALHHGVCRAWSVSMEPGYAASRG